MTPRPASLPQPDAAQHAVSERLLAVIKAAVATSGGWLRFDDYMRHALYTPGLGYYSGGSRKFGAAGDFITAPELTPCFAAALAAPIMATHSALRGGAVLELGAGSGRLAADLLRALSERHAVPERYLILELSGELRARQRQTLATWVPTLLDRVEWLDTLPTHFEGTILGNEVLDAMPCRLVVWRAGQWWERGVVWADGLAWQDRPLDDMALVAHLDPSGWPDGYLTEIQPQACGLITSLADCVQRGVLLLLDYGFDAATYYHPQRSRGTLMCHYRHHAHDDPFFWPGLQDITTHVDFSAIWCAADAAGWQLEGYASQAGFLLDAGVLEALAALPPGDAATLRETAAVQKLLSPAEMGELFKAIAFSKGVALPGLLPGFRREDRSGEL
jgi:SAM-dependent MidA family methyltransferase